MKEKLSTVAKRSIFLGILIVIVAGCALWWRYDWLPSVQVGTAQSLLVGIIQTQAGIWTMAVSFSLLYVQISVDAYSLRAARLLLGHSAFRQMTRYYVLSLVLNSVMALFVTEEPEFVPLMLGLVGVVLFMCGLAVMTTYVTDVVHYITPENIIGALRLQMRQQRIEEEALAATVHRDGWTDAPTVRMPASLAEQSRIGDDLRVLIDVAKRMAKRSDHIAVRAAIDGIVRLNPSEKLVMSLEEYHERLAADEGTEEEIATKRKRLAERAAKKELARSAMLAYRAGALMEIWASAVQSEDQVTAVMLIDAIESMLGDDVLSNYVARTNVLEAVIRDQMFNDTGRLVGWLDLRRQVVRLLTDRLDRINRDDLTSKYPNTWSVFNLLADMGRVLLREERADFASEREVFQGISILGRYGAAVCDASIISNVSLYLRDRARRGRSEVWRHQDYMAERPMAELVAEMGSRWVRAAPPKDYKSFWYLLGDGTEEVVKAYNQALDPSLDFYPSPANFDYLNALEKIAIACIETEHWKCFKDTLWRMNQLVTDLKRTPGLAAACFAEVLETAIKMSQSKAIELWIEAVKEFLYRNRDVDGRAFERLLRAARQAQASSVVASGSELEAKLTDLTEQLEKAHTERRSNK